MLINTSQFLKKIFYQKKKKTMNLNILPKLYIINIFFYLNERSNHKNANLQQSNIVI
jgi:hypothetical protein